MLQPTVSNCRQSSQYCYQLSPTAAICPIAICHIVTNCHQLSPIVTILLRTVTNCRQTSQHCHQLLPTVANRHNIVTNCRQSSQHCYQLLTAVTKVSPTVVNCGQLPSAVTKFCGLSLITNCHQLLPTVANFHEHCHQLSPTATRHPKAAAANGRGLPRGFKAGPGHKAASPNARERVGATKLKP